MKKDFSVELVQMMRECLEESIKNASSRGVYNEIANRLSFMAKIPGGKDTAVSMRENWLVAYKNKPALKDELNRAKL